MIITIDGPAGSGKSTAARKLAKTLGIAYLDTGATYRAATYKALRDGVDMSDQQALAQVAEAMDLKFVTSDRGQQVMLDGRDISVDIRTSRVTENIHYLANSPAVRQVLVGLQRRIGEQLDSFVTEGRDQGSVVFPQAQHKFYLDASPDERARRRCAEMQAAGERVEYDDIHSAIVERDAKDSSRAVAPLTRPRGAIVVDTSGITIEQMVGRLQAHVEGGL